MAVYSEDVLKKIDALEEQIYKHERVIEKLKRTIEQIQTKPSPIQPGNVITWQSGKATKHGEVISVSSEWKGEYSYRVTILNKGNQPVGFATVNESREPTLVAKKRRVKRK